MSGFVSKERTSVGLFQMPYWRQPSSNHFLVPQHVRAPPSNGPHELAFIQLSNSFDPTQAHEFSIWDNSE